MNKNELIEMINEADKGLTIIANIDDSVIVKGYEDDIYIHMAEIIHSFCKRRNKSIHEVTLLLNMLVNELDNL